jgi:hypothetical protein
MRTAVLADVHNIHAPRRVFFTSVHRQRFGEDMHVSLLSPRHMPNLLLLSAVVPSGSSPRSLFGDRHRPWPDLSNQYILFHQGVCRRRRKKKPAHPTQHFSALANRIIFVATRALPARYRQQRTLGRASCPVNRRLHLVLLRSDSFCQW